MKPAPERFAREIAQLVSAFTRAATLLSRIVRAALDGASPDEATAGVAEVSGALSQAVGAWAGEHAPRMYAAGVRDAGVTSVDATLRASLEVRVADVSSRLLSATRSMEEDAKGQIRSIALRRLGAVMRGEQGLGAGAEEFRAEIEERGIRVRDKAGRNLDPGSYARMALRTASGQLLNSGHADSAATIGSPGIAIFDNEGPNSCRECHEANGEVWSVAYFAAHLLQHPNCVRSGAAKPSSWTGTLDRVMPGEETEVK